MLIDFRQLFPQYNIKPKGVLHIGANIGEEAPIYNELGITNVIWIEANPYIIARLRNNVDKYGHKVYNFAVSDENTNAILHESNNASQSSSLLELGTHKNQHPEVYYVRDIPVQVLRLDSFLNGEFSGLDFLNIDIQGNEMKALLGMGNTLNNFQWAYIECNKDYVYEGCALVGEVEEYMKDFGFRMVESKWVGNWGDCLFIK